MNQQWMLYLFSFLFSLSAHLQEEVVTPLPVELNESSGLIALDSLFLSINDSGNKPVVYVFDQTGVLRHKCLLTNAVNVDWEALSLGENGKIYIGDIGNNRNSRQDLAIYQVDLIDVLTLSTAFAEKITFHYPDQLSFPPQKKDFNYDAEALICRGDSLFIYTKNRTEPYSGVVQVYGLSRAPGHQQARKYPSISLPNNFWFENSVTDVCVNMNSLFALTYRYIYVFNLLSPPVLIDTIEFTSVSQKEGVSYRNGALYITDEKTLLGKSRLYKISYPE
jgi:hypothetical protein